MKDLSPEEAGRWLSGAPVPVQEIVTGSLPEHVAQELGRAYKLHLDTTEILLKLIGYLLVGYARPDEFLRELEIKGVSSADARAMLSAVNQKIFIPLHEKMRLEEKNAPAPRVVQKPPVVPVQTQTQTQTQTPVPTPVPVSRPAPLMEKNFAPQGSATLPPKRVLPPMSIGIAPPRPTTSASPQLPGERLLADHEEPHINVSAAPVAFSPPKSFSVPREAKPPAFSPPPVSAAPATSSIPSATSPAPPAPPSSVPPVTRAPFSPPTPTPPFPKVASVPENRPVAPVQKPSPSPLPPPPAKAPSTPLTAYPVDPYREPPE